MWKHSWRFPVAETSSCHISLQNVRAKNILFLAILIWTVFFNQAVIRIMEEIQICVPGEKSVSAYSMCRPRGWASGLSRGTTGQRGASASALQRPHKSMGAAHGSLEVCWGTATLCLGSDHLFFPSQSPHASLFLLLPYGPSEPQPSWAGFLKSSSPGQ